MDINISESNILDRIRKVTSSIGKIITDKEGTSLYDNIRIITQDEPLIKDYIKTAYSEMVVLLRDYIVDNVYPQITLAYSTSINGKVEIQSSLLVEDYIVYTSLFMWFSARNKDLAEFYNSLSQNTGTSILRLFVKQPPVSPTHNYPYTLSDNGTVVNAVVGDVNIIKYIIGDNETDDIIFLSSNTLVASITDNYYTAIGIGTAIITVMSKHNNFAKFELNIIVS